MGESVTRILLIEDNPPDQRLIQEYLRAGPFELQSARTLEEGLTLLEGWRVDLILLDLSLPDSRGLETLAGILARAPDASVVVLTGLDDEALALEAVRGGAQDYLVKGRVDETLLVRTIRYAVERRRIQQRLRESEERFRRISASAQDPVIVMDTGGRISFWNTAAARVFGYTETEAVGADLHSLLAPEQHRDLFRRRFPRFLESGRGEVVGKTITMHALRKGGEEFPVELSISAFRERDGWGAMAIIRDIASRQEMERLMQVSEKMGSVGRLAAGVAHEINNPLSTALLNLELLQSRLGKIPQAQGLERYLAAIERGLTRAGEITRELMSFAGPEKREATIFNLNDPINGALTLLGPRLKAATLRRTLAGGAFVRGFPGKLEQVFLNLLENALDAMPEGGELSIASQLTDSGEVMVEVIDSGGGIPEGNLSRIFDPFFTTKKVGKGSGLGLSVSYHIVRQHGGRMEATNQVDHGGACFRVILPFSG